MFNSQKFVDSVLDQELARRIAGVEKMLLSAPCAYSHLLSILLFLSREDRERLIGNLQQAMRILFQQIPQSFTSRDMNQGKGMIFHPVSGDPIKTLRLESSRQVVHYAADTTGGEWGSGRKERSTIEDVRGEFFWKNNVQLPIIGSGRANGARRSHVCLYHAGDPYLVHWKYCPWTGAELKKGAKDE